MDLLLSVCVGLGLAAACGFRVFVPLLGMSIAANAGHLSLAKGFAWIGSDIALVAFSIATLLEIGGYYIPWVDNFLDTVATPAAIVAGTVVTASMVGDVSPFLKWSLAVIGGGGAAGIIQAGTVLTRGASSVGTAGLANPILATVELGGSILTTILAMFLPLFAVFLVGSIIFFVSKRILSRRKSAEGV
jgi:hypothetical protein